MECIPWIDNCAYERLHSQNMVSIYQKTGTNIQRIRKELFYTQEKLAELSYLDIKSVIRIEAGKRNPTIKTLNKIAKVLKVSISTLLK